MLQISRSTYVDQQCEWFSGFLDQGWQLMKYDFHIPQSSSTLETRVRDTIDHKRIDRWCSATVYRIPI